MTCIAYRGGTLAADSCITEEDGYGNPVHRSCARKLKILVNPESADTVVAVASRGDTGAGDAVDIKILHHLLNHDIVWSLTSSEAFKSRRKAIGDAEYEAIGVVYESRLPTAIYIGNGGVAHVITDAFFAIGCDAGYARAAMEAGADAELAVAIATKYGVYSATPVHWIRGASDSDRGTIV